MISPLFCPLGPPYHNRSCDSGRALSMGPPTGLNALQTTEKKVNWVPGGPNPSFVAFSALWASPTATGVPKVVEHFRWGPQPD